MFHPAEPPELKASSVNPRAAACCGGVRPVGLGFGGGLGAGFDTGDGGRVVGGEVGIELALEAFDDKASKDC